MLDPKVDIKEKDILDFSPKLLNTLLKDHTLSTEDKQVNIFCATENYDDRGAGSQDGSFIFTAMNLKGKVAMIEKIGELTGNKFTCATKRVII